MSKLEAENVALGAFSCGEGTLVVAEFNVLRIFSSTTVRNDSKNRD